MPDDSFDPLFYMICFIFRLDVMVPKADSQILDVKLAHAGKEKYHS